MLNTDEYNVGGRKRHIKWVGYIFMWVQLRGGGEGVQLLIGIHSKVSEHHGSDGFGLGGGRRAVRGGRRWREECVSGKQPLRQPRVFGGPPLQLFGGVHWESIFAQCWLSRYNNFQLSMFSFVRILGCGFGVHDNSKCF